MTKCICDICGAFFCAQTSNTINSKTKFSNKVRLIDNGNYIDICPVCVNALQELINARTDANNTEV